MVTATQIKSFIADMGPIAQQVGTEYGIDPAVILTQAAHESGFGTAAPGNNYFGIKGKGQTFATTEQGAGGLYNTTGSFRTYPSMEASVRGWANLVTNLYPGVIGATPSDAFKALKAGGYASDDKYVSKLNGVLGTLNDYGMGHPIPPANVPGVPAAKDWAAAYANAGQPKNAALTAIDAATGSTIPLPPARPAMGNSPAAPASTANLYNQHWVPVPLAPLPNRPNSDLAANAGDNLAFSPTAGNGVPSLNSDNANYPVMDAQIDPATGLMRANANSAAVRSNYATPNAAGSPDDRSNPALPPISQGIAGYTQMPPGARPSSVPFPSTFPVRPDVVAPNVRAGSMTDIQSALAALRPSAPVGGPALTEAQKLAMIATPPATPTAPIPMPASARPAAPAPPTNAKGYVIGQEYPMANGAIFRANADGSFTKTASTPRSPTIIQTLMEASKPGVMQTASNLVNGAKSAGPATIDAAKGVGASIGSAATGVGSLLSGLFNRATTPSLPAPLAYGNAPGQVGQSPAPTQTYHSSPISYTPPQTSSPSNYGSQGYSGNSSYGPSSYAPPTLQSIASMSPSALAEAAAPTTRAIINPAYLAWANGQPAVPASPFTNPGVQGLSPDDRQALNDANNATQLNLSAQQTALGLAPPHYLTVKNPINPQYEPPLAYPTGGNPVAALFNRTHIGGLLSFLGGGQNASDMLFGNNSTGVNRSVPQLPPPLSMGLTPQQYDASTPEYRTAVAAGQTGYTPAGSNTLMPTTTLAGTYRNNYGDSSSSGSLASRG